jgi:SAM-dependent methyltransferase
MLHVNHAFVLDEASKLASHGGIFLDYGCGRGETVQHGLKQGMEIFGVDAFYAGCHGYDSAAGDKGLLGKRIFALENGRIPFPDQYFDVVFHNQVFEHVSSLSEPLSEIHRVLKPGGVMLSLFPSKEVWREGHFGIPMLHRVQGKIAVIYAFGLRRIGFGKDFEGADVGVPDDPRSSKEWATMAVTWMSRWCFYRPETEIRRNYRAAGFTFEHRELDYVLYRLARGSCTWAVPVARALPALASFAFRKLGGMVLISRIEAAKEFDNHMPQGPHGRRIVLNSSKETYSQNKLCGVLQSYIGVRVTGLRLSL